MQQEAKDTENELRSTLDEATERIRELEPGARRSLVVERRATDMEQRLRDLQDDLGEESDAREVVAKALLTLKNNEKRHVETVQRCQNAVDDLARTKRRENQRRAERGGELSASSSSSSRRGRGTKTPRSSSRRTISTPSTPTTPSFLRQGEGRGSVPLTTPISPATSGYGHGGDHQHEVGSGHRHCPTCEAKREELAMREMMEGGGGGSSSKRRKAEKGGEEEGGGEEMGTALWSESRSESRSESSGRRRERRSKRKGSNTLVGKTQRVAVELSAAIQLLDKSLERYQESCRSL